MNYTEKKHNNIKVFEDTQKFYNENEKLNKAMRESRQNTVCFQEDDYPEITNTGKGRAEVSVTRERTFECAVRLSEENPVSRIAVLNFASSSNSGGGVLQGSSAQEEALCRCSTLYPTLNQKTMWEQFYTVNRMNRNVLHTDACIYSPGIVVCKTDDYAPKRLPESDWRTVDVITCAAPNLRDNPSNAYNAETGDCSKITYAELYEIHLKRAKHIMHIAAARGVNVLVLGAFGCGAFRNDPAVVAEAYKAALIEMGKYFDKVVFAIYCGRYETENYDIFNEIIKR